MPDPPPDTQDWTWVLDRPCPDCGFDGADLGPHDVADGLAATRDRWSAVLGRVDVRERPAATTWSPLEYAAHVRDVHRVFDGRLARMLEEDGPTFADWDQDATAREDRYATQEPAVVAAELADACDAVVARYRGVGEADRHRPGLRSNGSAFTVTTLGRYHLHDVVHHLHDVARRAAAAGRADAQAVTVGSYEESAAAFAAATAEPTALLREQVDAFAARVGPGARVLEVGSGGGRDARLLEQRGVSVRRTDVSAAFVALLRAAGHEADQLDPLVDPLADPLAPDTAYDGVWAAASLLHVARGDLPQVLSRLAAATREGGALHLSVKEGDGERWSTHGAVGGPRLFTLWREPALRSAVESAGWVPTAVLRQPGARGERWLALSARRGRTDPPAADATAGPQGDGASCG
nr:methyltransferase domain-containing protein [Nocardioides perillae]